jgi:ankyrin repeat protein
MKFNTLLSNIAPPWNRVALCMLLGLGLLGPHQGNAMSNISKVFKGGPVIELALAAEAGDLDRVRQLIQLGADVKEVGQQGMTVTHYALRARKNAPQVMDALLRAGADPISPLSSGDTVPRYAVVRDHADPLVVQVLLDHGLSPNWRPAEGGYTRQSLLMAAVGGRNLPVLKLLVQRGAELNYLHPISGSALHLALNGTDFFMAAFLVESGIDLSLKNNTSPLIKNPNSSTAIERFCRLESGKRGANPLPEIAAGWQAFTTPLAARGVRMPCGL